MSISLEDAIKSALSAARIGTYEAVCTAVPPLPDALRLYAWNAQVSAAMLAPLHICEVVVRNAVSDALTSVYGSRWPWSSGFVQSLPNPSKGYNARTDLLATRQKWQTTGQVIPELKFVFWQTMFTSRFDSRLWMPHLRTVMPHLAGTSTVRQLCSLIYTELEQLRKLRNRIAHHEPIFSRNLVDDFQKIHDLIAFRCTVTAGWMVQNQQAQMFIQNRP